MTAQSTNDKLQSIFDFIASHLSDLSLYIDSNCAELRSLERYKTMSTIMTLDSSFQQDTDAIRHLHCLLLTLSTIVGGFSAPLIESISFNGTSYTIQCVENRFFRLRVDQSDQVLHEWLSYVYSQLIGKPLTNSTDFYNHIIAFLSMTKNQVSDVLTELERSVNLINQPILPPDQAYQYLYILGLVPSSSQAIFFRHINSILPEALSSHLTKTQTTGEAYSVFSSLFLSISDSEMKLTIVSYMYQFLKQVLSSDKQDQSQLAQISMQLEARIKLFAFFLDSLDQE